MAVPQFSDCKLLLQNGMQLPDVRALAGFINFKNEFDSRSLSHTVRGAEKSSDLTLEIARNRRNSVILQFFLSNRTRESLALSPSVQLSGLFLWRPDTQSGFKDSARRMHYDHKPIIRRKRP